jgi:hypothetical protein
MLVFLLFSSLALQIGSTDLKIESDNLFLTASQDSILTLKITVRNESKNKIKLAKLFLGEYEMPCYSPTWRFKIYSLDSCKKNSYSLPFQSCFTGGKMWIILRNNEEYCSKVLINFKFLHRDGSPYTDQRISNRDFGEYELQLRIKISEDKYLESNCLTVCYQDK